ncbi:MAG TPA: hypothetical protein DCK79_11350 [Candidatus Atribacteria bacterium]|jgi:hypothetical protein|nr:hypothetical protein [Candidatus Atribacteria bacterium]
MSYIQGEDRNQIILFPESIEEYIGKDNKGMTIYVTKQVYSNGTGDKDFYPDRFSYDADNDYYLCPARQKLYYYRTRKKHNQILGDDYRNSKACQRCL